MCKAQLLIRGHFEPHSLYSFQQYVLKYGIFKIFDDDSNWSKLLYNERATQIRGTSAFYSRILPNFYLKA